MSGDLLTIVREIPWYAWLALVAILCGSITKLVAMGQRHRERMEMIRQGMHPDGGKSAQSEL